MLFAASSLPRTRPPQRPGHRTCPCCMGSARHQNQRGGVAKQSLAGAGGGWSSPARSERSLKFSAKGSCGGGRHE
jgi:hypothetical protein